MLNIGMIFSIKYNDIVLGRQIVTPNPYIVIGRGG
jgi:hypothetical protein